MFNVYSNVNNYFSRQLEPLECKDTTKAYIVSIFSKYKFSHFDYSTDSLTLIYCEARLQNDFAAFQNLADWIFFCEVIFPQFLNNASKDYYHSIAQVSYYNCYRLINKQLDLYENLADEFSSLTNSTKDLIQRI